MKPKKQTRKTRKKFDPMDRSRPVMLHLGADGTLCLEPLFGAMQSPGDWRDGAIDALHEGKIELAKRVLDDNRFEPINNEPEAECYTLPVFTCDSIEQAKQIRVRFCKLMYGRHLLQALGEPWYVINRFEGGLEELYRVQKEFSAFYQEIKRVDQTEQHRFAVDRKWARR